MVPESGQRVVRFFMFFERSEMQIALMTDADIEERISQCERNVSVLQEKLRRPSLSMHKRDLWEYQLSQAREGLCRLHTRACAPNWGILALSPRRGGVK